jgi:CheY-like chemotaxis protein
VRIVVCDDDVDMRSMLTSLVEQRGHSVIAETDNAEDARRLIERFNADLVVLDLSLRLGGAHDLLVALTAGADPTCRVVIFSAFTDDIAGLFPTVSIVDKPNFPALEAALDRLVSAPQAVATERRRPPARTGSVPPRAAAIVEDQPQEFYRALEAAEPGDSLLAATVIAGGAVDPVGLDILASVAVRAVRVQDHIIKQPSCLVVLLVGGAPGTAEVIQGRLQSGMKGAPELVFGHAILAVDEPPSDAFLRITREIRDLVAHVR